MCSRLD